MAPSTAEHSSIPDPTGSHRPGAGAGATAKFAGSRAPFTRSGEGWPPALTARWCRLSSAVTRAARPLGFRPSPDARGYPDVLITPTGAWRLLSSVEPVRASDG